MPRMMRSEIMKRINPKNRSKVRKILNRLIRLVIFIAACVFIFRQVLMKNDLASLAAILEKDIQHPEFLTGLVLVFLLMPGNWGIEAIKWRFLIRKVEDTGFLKSFQAVLTGISISSFTPNRVGEYFGRVFILNTASRIEGILITVVGSMSQLLVTLLAGSAAFLVFVPRHAGDSLFGHGYFYFGLTALIIMLDLMLLALYFRIPLLVSLRDRLQLPILKRFRKFFRVFGLFRSRELAGVVLLSFARYLVFSTQFYMLLLLFGVKIPYFQALTLIALVYLIMTILPTVAITELGVRGSVAMYIFGLGMGSPGATDTGFAVFMASAALWVINLVIPALAGSLLVFRLQFVRKTDL